MAIQQGSGKANDFELYPYPAQLWINPSLSLQLLRVRLTTPQQVVPIDTELHHVSMQRTHGVRGGTPTASIPRGRHRRRPAPTPSGHGSLRGAAAVSEAETPSLSAHHPPQGTAADRSLGRNDDLRNGAPRRVPAPLQPDAALRRVGSE